VLLCARREKTSYRWEPVSRHCFAALLQVGPTIPSGRLENGETLCCCKQQTKNKKKESLLCSRESKRCSLGLLILVTMVAGDIHCRVLYTPVWVERKESARPCKKKGRCWEVAASQKYIVISIYSSGLHNRGTHVGPKFSKPSEARWMLISTHHGQLNVNCTMPPSSHVLLRGGPSVCGTYKQW
jgi:hypothetical protein